ISGCPIRPAPGPAVEPRAGSDTPGVRPAGARVAAGQATDRTPFGLPAGSTAAAQATESSPFAAPPARASVPGASDSGQTQRQTGPPAGPSGPPDVEPGEPPQPPAGRHSPRPEGPPGAEEVAVAAASAA